MKYILLLMLACNGVQMEYDASVDAPAVSPDAQQEPVKPPGEPCNPMNGANDIQADTQFGLGDKWEIPSAIGTIEARPAAPQTLVRAAVYNGPMLEILNLQTELGVTADISDSAQLAKAFEQNAVPDPSEASLIVAVPGGEIVFQRGWYSRVGCTVTYSFAISWANTDGPSGGDPLRVLAPFQSSGAVFQDTWTGTVFAGQSEFFGDNGVLGWTYQARFHNVTDFEIHIEKVSTPGVLVAITKGIAAEGDRKVQGFIVYRTDGTRAVDWPFIEWVETGDLVHNTIPDITYYGAQAGDQVSVRDSVDFEVDLVNVAALPSATIPINLALTKAGGSPYTLVHRGQRSRPLVVIDP